MKERQPIKLDSKAVHQTRLSSSGEPGLVRRGAGKLMDGTTWVSKKTFVPFAAVWGTSVVFPGLVPAAVGTGAGIGAATDAGALLLDKTRNKDKGGSLPKQGNIFTRGIRSVGSGVWSVPRDTFRQVNPVQGSTKGAFGY